MDHSFEEVAVREVDDLYREALFLGAGNEARAEALLLDTLARAFRVPAEARPGGEARRWLQGRMVRRFLERAGAEPGAGENPEDAEGDAPFSPLEVEGRMRFDTVEPRALFDAAGRLPPRARAAIWLVVFGRWSYEEAAEILDAGRDELRNLLRYRHAFLVHLMKSDGGGHAGGEMAL